MFHKIQYSTSISQPWQPLYVALCPQQLSLNFREEPVLWKEWPASSIQGYLLVDTVLDVGDESTAHLLHEILSLYLLVFEFPLYWKHLSAKQDVKGD